jgi:hypothetical protein
VQPRPFAIKLVARTSKEKLLRSTTTSAPTAGLTPDVAVAETREEIGQGRDAAPERALEIAKG